MFWKKIAALSPLLNVSSQKRAYYKYTNRIPNKFRALYLEKAKDLGIDLTLNEILTCGKLK